MKKLQTLIAAFLLSLFGATTAHSEMAFGVTGAYALLDASGSETEGNGKEKTSTEIDHNFGVASIFAEYTFSGVTFGLDYIPGSADVSENVKSRTDVETSVTDTAAETTTSRSQKAQDEISRLEMAIGDSNKSIDVINDSEIQLIRDQQRQLSDDKDRQVRETYKVEIQIQDAETKLKEVNLKLEKSRQGILATAAKAEAYQLN